MKKIKLNLLPFLFLFIFVCSLFLSAIPTFAYEPITIEVPFTFSNFEKKDKETHSLTITDSNGDTQDIEYDILSEKQQYYNLTFTRPDNYKYTITYTDNDNVTNYTLDVFIYIDDDDTLAASFYVCKEGDSEKVELSFIGEKSETPIENPTETPEEKPSEDEKKEEETETPTETETETEKTTEKEKETEKEEIKKQETNTTTDKDNSTSVKTGDNYSLIVVLSGLGIVFLLVSLIFFKKK